MLLPFQLAPVAIKQQAAVVVGERSQSGAEEAG